MDISRRLSKDARCANLGIGILTGYVVMGGVLAKQVAEYAAEDDVDCIVTGGHQDRHFGPVYKPNRSRTIANRTDFRVLIMKIDPASFSRLFEKDD